MTKRILFPALLLTLYILVSLSITASAADKISITGTIMAVGLDNNDKVLSVHIETKDGPYIVHEKTMALQLAKFIGQGIVAVGSIGEDTTGNRTIKVKTFSIVR